MGKDLNINGVHVSYTCAKSHSDKCTQNCVRRLNDDNSYVCSMLRIEIQVGGVEHGF